MYNVLDVRRSRNSGCLSKQLSHGIPTGCRVTSCSHPDSSLEKEKNCLDLLLECRNWECFHNCPCWLGLHLGLNTEHKPGACFCRWLCLGLDAAEAWYGEDTSLLHLLRSNGSKAVEDLRDLLGLQLVRCCDVLDQGTLGQGLAAAGGLHGLRLHRLHWSHDLQQGVEI